MLEVDYMLSADIKSDKISKVAEISVVNRNSSQADLATKSLFFMIIIRFCFYVIHNVQFNHANYDAHMLVT